MLDIDRSTSKNFWTTLGWSAYLACSWTWCIGMFLPVLLVRDYGVLGWVIFAIPNVIGAAAMGWVIGNRTQSRLLIAHNLSACSWFSIITMAFQVFFLMWISPRLGFPLTFVVGMLLGMEMCNRVIFRYRNPTLRASVITLSFSVIMIVAFAATGAARIPTHRAPFYPSRDLIWLAPVCVFGFLLNPYLDLSFHHARRSVGEARARVVFGFGFGVLFFLMIVFTLMYAQSLFPVVRIADALPWYIALPIGLHFACQCIFTASVHSHEASTRRRVAIGKWNSPKLQNLIFVMSSIAGGFAGILPFTFRNLDGGEFIYRLFMSFYGLVFPAYVWLCMIPSWRTQSAPTRENLVIFWIAILIAAPMYWMGFIEQKMFWLAPGLAVVLLARLALSSQAKAPLPSPGINAGA